MKKRFFILVAILGLAVSANAQSVGDIFKVIGSALQQSTGQSSNQSRYSDSYNRSSGNNSSNRSDYSYVKAVRMYKFTSNQTKNMDVNLYEDASNYYISCFGKYYTVSRNSNYGGNGQTSSYRYYVNVYSSNSSVSGYWYFNF